MSCDWHVHCVECNETLRFEDANHQVILMRHIIAMRERLAAIGIAAREFEWPLECNVTTSFGTVDCGFFARHEGHRLRPIDEYGQLDGDCGARFKCDCCASHLFCKLPHGHDGEHAQTS